MKRLSSYPFKVYAETRLKRCHFHFTQSVYKHIQSCGLQTLYGSDVVFNGELKKIMALAFVPVGDVIFTYELLITTRYFVDNEQLLEEFFNYIEKTWIGVMKRTGRGNPLYNIEIWNSYADVLGDKPRTNNNIEGWHNGFAKSVGKHHAEMAEFIDCIKLEQNKTELLMEQSNTGLEISPPNRKKYKNYDERLKNVVSNYDQADVLEYLKNVAALLL